MEAPRCRGRAFRPSEYREHRQGLTGRTSRPIACLSWSYPVPRSSRRRRSGYWVHRSPLGVRAPSGSFVILSSSEVLRYRATTSSNLGSASEALPGTADLVPALASRSSGRLLPWTFWPVQRSRRAESDSRPGHSKFPAPSPPDVSHVLRGFVLRSPCHHFQMTDALRVHPFRAFFLPDPGHRLVAGAALLDVSPRETLRSVARRGVVFRGCIPEGFRCPRSGTTRINR